MQNTTIRQVVDRTFSLSALAPGSNASSKTQTAAGNRLRDLRHYIEVVARRHHGAPVLVTAQKAVIEALGELPANVRTEHFNALSGLDRHRDVRCHIQIGEPGLPRGTWSFAQKF